MTPGYKTVLKIRNIKISNLKHKNTLAYMPSENSNLNFEVYFLQDNSNSFDCLIKSHENLEKVFNILCWNSSQVGFKS